MRNTARVHPLLALPAAALEALGHVARLAFGLALMVGMLLLGLALLAFVLLWALLRGRWPPAFAAMRARTTRQGGWPAAPGARRGGGTGEVVDVEAREIGSLRR